MISTVLDVVIGAVFVFFVCSVLASGVHELFTQVLATRSKQLWRTLGGLLDGSRGGIDARTLVGGLNGKRDPRPQSGASTGSRTEALARHALIHGFEDPSKRLDSHTRISHIESDNFTRALIDIVAGDEKISTTAEFEKAVAKLGDGTLKDELSVIVRHADDAIDSLRSDIGAWFDQHMAALQAAYRRRTRLWLFVIGLIVAVGFNVDAVRVTTELYQDDALRAAVVQEAERYAADPECIADTGELTEACETQLRATADSLTLPIWWGEDADVGPLSPVGWILASAAIAQGGPFWFEWLRRIAGFKRSAVAT